MFQQAAKFNQPLAWDTSKVLLGVLKQSNKKGVPRQRTFYWGWDMGWDGSGGEVPQRLRREHARARV